MEVERHVAKINVTTFHSFLKASYVSGEVLPGLNLT